MRAVGQVWGGPWLSDALFGKQGVARAGRVFGNSWQACAQIAAYLDDACFIQF